MHMHTRAHILYHFFAGASQRVCPNRPKASAATVGLSWDWVHQLPEPGPHYHTTLVRRLCKRIGQWHTVEAQNQQFQQQCWGPGPGCIYVPKRSGSTPKEFPQTLLGLVVGMCMTHLVRKC